MTSPFEALPVHFTLPARDARGRFVRLDSVLREILAAHDYPTCIKLVLAEAITLAALIGSLMKQDGGQVTIQAQTEGGIVELLVVDYRGGELRGHVRFDAERLARLGANPSLFALFGKGYLAMTFDQSFGKGRYQGIVPLDGDSLSQACESYFTQSEQVPTMIRIAIESDATGCRSAGYLVQHLPEGEEGRERLHVRLDHPEWEHVSILSSTLTHSELLDPAVDGRDLLWRLFHEEDEVRAEDGVALVKGCRCNLDHIRDVIGRFPPEEQAEMVGDTGTIVVDCAFCSRAFHIDPPAATPG
ncbi:MULTISPECIES: Hsp33 family molecular chaperone HslO [Blastomonas]|jgi:molecular chaperone Hsp33|uniref:Molecular chaperone Hsp33 n=1 Tax=Blastomonas fulva TaxID=1550728 RepID=A0ABM6M7K5_9SPHN|nr:MULTISPECIES: Hsp33 family molecular chaperone HslO [Blastomonas]AOF99322.1 hsp33 family protein [Blastomonas sp. RAC04]ASR51980.1 molecular chaperone Hsp33 [Blastomonas fulva]MCO5794226.1 Hsp33 family molecular chaperone HslO [Blastomonas sp.]MDM7930207.1 Hsp33 family molecular chaperone HslO [Blastomonas fulva]MDM7965913.1 Hsp33 family molecular chaperone HslO [Blastomonas fulva]